MTNAADTARVLVTEAAARLIDELRSGHGALMFHQSGGCCDGSAPMCYPQGEFRIGQRDVRLGDVHGCPFYMGGDQYELWKHTQIILDVVPGRGSGFSLESPTGNRFLIRSRVLDDGELKWLDAHCPVVRGPSVG